MNYASSIAERAVLSVDRFINRAMASAWTSTLEHRCPGGELMPPPWGLQPSPEQEYGGGDLCSPRRKLRPTVNHSNDR